MTHVLSLDRQEHYTALTQCGSSYNWAAHMLLAMVAIEPRVLSLALEPAHATRHYIGLALAALHARPLVSPSLQELAHRIATEPRRMLLSALWGTDLGSVSCLSRCGRTILDEEEYLQIAQILGDPLKRAAFMRLRSVSRRGIAHLADASDVELSRWAPALLNEAPPQALAFVSQRLAQLRPDLSATDIDARLNAASAKRDIAQIIMGTLDQAALPSPPWSGNGLIVPVETVLELRRLGRVLRNCLGDHVNILDAIEGVAAFYLAKGSEPCVVRLTRQNGLGGWRLSTLRAARNRMPSEQRKAAIVAAFAEVGVLHVADEDLHPLLPSCEFN